MSTADSDTSGGAASPDLPGAGCGPVPPAVEPPLPEGCVHAWLVDSKGNAMEGAYSGLVECPDTNGGFSVAFRTAAVACPELVGDECLCDADCEAGSACICANTATTLGGLGLGPANRCMTSDCAGAGDCRGLQCRVDVGPCVGAPVPQAIRCTSPTDDCVFPSECTSPPGELCDYDELDERFTCDPGAICE